MTDILLVRHGQTDWNLEGRIQGQTDIPLNAEGIQQAQIFADRIRDDKFDTVFSSDLQRALQTARVIADRLTVPLFKDQRLQEINYGQWEGMLVSEVRRQFASEYTAFRDERPNARPPGGETLREVYNRMKAAVDDSARIYPKGRILIVSHGLALAVFRCGFNKLPLNHYIQFGMDNCIGELVRWDPDLA